jgi:transposase InsO family protein
MEGKEKTREARNVAATRHDKRRPWPLEMKVALAKSVVEQKLTTFAVAKKLGVPYTTAIQWVQVYRGGGAIALEPKPRPIASGGERRSRAKTEAIVATKRGAPQAGSRRIRDLMRRFLGIGTSETTVRRVLKAEGMKPQVSKRRVRREHPVRHFERAEPNQLWQSDIFTFLLRRHERLYVAAFLDDHSRYLVSVAMAHHQRSVLVLEALSRGIADYGAPREILTDQGRQYTTWRGSTEFEAELKRHGIQHLKSRPQHPQTCGKIERFWKTLWEELLSRTVFADYEDCQRRMGLFIQHYNFQRPHQGIEGMTPADRFFKASAQVRECIESQVAENALRLARERPPVKPFYLAGQLGDQRLAISASAAALSVRVGDEHTTIPFKESEHEHNRVSRFGAGDTEEHATPEASGGLSAEVVAEPERSAGDRARSVLDGALGAVGAEDGKSGDRGAEDLPDVVLPAGGSGTEGHGARAEPGEKRVDERAARAAPGAGEAATAQCPSDTHDAAQEKRGTVAGARDEGEPRVDQHGAARTTPESPVAVDDAWRRLALIWERKLCGERATFDREVDDEEAFDLYGEPRGATGATAQTCGDPAGAERDGDGERCGTAARSVTQSLPVAAASLTGGNDPGDHPEGTGATAEVATAERTGAQAQGARAGERAAASTHGGDR